jgi:uncharacterized protein YxeA
MTASSSYNDLPVHIRELIYDSLDVATRFKTYCAVKEDTKYMTKYIEDCGLPALFNIESKLLNTNNLLSIEVKIPQLCIYWSAFYIYKGEHITKWPYYKTTKDLAKQLVKIKQQRHIPRTLDMIVYSNQGNDCMQVDFNNRWERMMKLNYQWDFVKKESIVHCLHDNRMQPCMSIKCHDIPKNPVNEDMLIQVCNEIIQLLSSVSK